jgi:phosphoglycolate phosphatase-like HAD superfamily hydrolase
VDGEDTLKIIAPSLTEEERKRLLADDVKHYEKTYLPRIRAFAGVKQFFKTIKAAGGAIALATDCKGTLLKVYRSLLDVDDLIDQIACGEDVTRASPTRGSRVWPRKSSAFPAGVA